MTYRKFDTHTWQDPWFEELSPQAKLLFIYLWTNEVCSQAGLYRISKRRVEFELGFKIEGPMEELSRKVFWDAERQIVWVKNFLRWQCQNVSFLKGALKAIESLPEDIQAHFLEHNRVLLEKHGLMDSGDGGNTMSTPSKDGDTTNPSSVTEAEAVQNRTEAEADKKKEGAAAPTVSNNGYVASIQVRDSDKPLNITTEQAQKWQETFGWIDVVAELVRLQEWSNAPPDKEKLWSKKGAMAACANRLGKMNQSALQEIKRKDPNFDPDDPDGSKEAQRSFEKTMRGILDSDPYQSKTTGGRA